MSKKSELAHREEISISQLPPRSFFKIGFLANIAVWGILCSIAGVRSIFGPAETVMGMTTVSGISGFFSWLMVGILVSLLGAAILTIGGLLVRIAARDVGFGKLVYTISAVQARKRDAEVRRRLQIQIEKETQKKEIPEGRLW